MEKRVAPLPIDLEVPSSPEQGEEEEAPLKVAKKAQPASPRSSALKYYD